MKQNLKKTNVSSTIFIYLLFYLSSSQSYGFLDKLFGSGPQTKITFEDCKTTVEIDGHPDPSEQISVSTKGCHGGKPSAVGVTHIIQPKGSNKRPKPQIYPIQLLTPSESFNQGDGGTETIGSLTQLEGLESILVSSLHGFRHELKKYSQALYDRLEDYKPIVFKMTESARMKARLDRPEGNTVINNEDARRDLVIFVKNSVIENLLSKYHIPFQKLSESKEAIGELRAYLLKEIQPHHNITSGDTWISPRQMGRVGHHTAEQDSRGTLSLVVPQTSEVYLAPSEYNFSTGSSSGSVIFSQSTAKPIGVVSCQMNQNLIQNGVEQNIKGTYRILTFELIAESEIDVLESVSEAIIETQNHLWPDPTCDWRDTKFGGGP